MQRGPSIGTPRSPSRQRLEEQDIHELDDLALALGAQKIPVGLGQEPFQLDTVELLACVGLVMIR